MHSIARQKSSDFDKIRYKAADFEPSDSHVAKKIFIQDGRRTPF